MHSVRQFELVKALATYRHFGRAAAALGVSQPALTRSLKHLEDVLGVPLFDRQGVTPTVFGELMLNHGEPVIKGFADLMREIDLAKGLEIGEFSVSAGPYPAEISGQRALGMLSAQHPQLAVEIEALQLDEDRQPGVERSASTSVSPIFPRRHKIRNCKSNRYEVPRCAFSAPPGTPWPGATT